MKHELIFQSPDSVASNKPLNVPETDQAGQSEAVVDEALTNERPDNITLGYN